LLLVEDHVATVWLSQQEASPVKNYWRGRTCLSFPPQVSLQAQSNWVILVLY
jgi:hypothetical protein